MENKNVKEFLGWSGLVLFLALMLYVLIVDPLLDTLYLKKDSAYAISSTVSRGPFRSTGSDIKYTFYIGGNPYTGFTRLLLKKDGTKYFIKFYPKNPERNKATTIVATSDDIKNMPPGGYRKLPHE